VPQKPGRHRLTHRPNGPNLSLVGALAVAGASLALILPAGSLGIQGSDAPSAAPSISLVASPGAVFAGEDALVSVVVAGEGDGGGQATLSILILLPPGAVLASVDAPAGGCSGTGPVTCEVADPGPGSESTLALGVSLTVAGPAAFSATVEGPGGSSADASVSVTGPSCTAIGTQGPDVLAGGDGDDVVCGLGADDDLAGGSGNDILVGGSGVDAASFEEADEPVTASLATGSSTGQGSDVLRGIENLVGSSRDDRLAGDAGRNSLAGGGGRDTVDFSAGSASVRVDLGAGEASGQGLDLVTGFEQVIGTPFGDLLIGTAGANKLEGRGGDDTLVGLGGSDEVIGGSGRDTASFAGATTGVTADLQAGSATGQGADRLEGIEGLSGSAQDDRLLASAGSNLLLGLGGADVLDGGEGADELEGGPGPDSLIGGAGIDTLIGGAGIDGCAQGVGSGSKVGCEALPLAEGAGLVVFEPTGSLIGVGFHESLFATAATMRPMGRLIRNANPGKFSPPPATDGPGYVVMGPRGRPSPATTAIDVVLPSRGAALSPVTGRVVVVRPYLLYCQFRDWQVAIEPVGRPDLRVMVLHMGSVQVHVGQRVAASVTVLGTAWTNDAVGSQENLYFPDQYPHIHVEIEEEAAVPIPGCPL
jgi:Ca2+-binding RTX toxin-like protein